MKERKDSRRWLIWLGWLVVGMAMLLPMTLTMGQRPDDEAKRRLDERTLRYPFPVSPSLHFPTSPSPRFTVSPPLPNPSRSRQGSGWMQDIVWFQPILTGKGVAFSPDGKLLATTGLFNSILI